MFVQPLDLEYIPGDITNADQQHPTRQILLQQKHDRDSGKSQLGEPNDLFLEKHQCNDQIALLGAQEKIDKGTVPHVLGDDVEDNFEKMKLNVEIPDKPNQRSPSPLIPAYCNFQTAKKMHQENLEHQPLPDCVMDKAFRKLQAQGLMNPGLALEVLPTAKGIGIKTYKAGPTHCTKMKIFRPKTCGIVPKPARDDFHRPQSSFNIKDKMGAMDLAICWDYRPLNPEDEPKRTKHIDGSNGSAAPAVFTLVKTPRTPDNIDTGRSGGIFTNTLGNEGFFDKDILRRKTGFAVQRSKSDLKCSCGTSPASFKDYTDAVYRSQSASRPIRVMVDKGTQPEGRIIGLPERQKRCKSSPNLSQIVHPSDYSYKENTSQYIQESPPQKVHTCSKYGPKNKQAEGRQNRRTKRMCQKIAPQPYPELTEKQVYKLAFKAGVPKSNSAGTVTSFDSGCSTMTSSGTCSTKVLNVPKPRHPYAKKNYDIDTLVPPFTSFRGGAGQGGYPEHWRLASVYQHAYKPIEMRKRPLLQTVYK